MTNQASGIEIGRVSERDNTRHHAIRDGHAACGRGKILLHHVVPLTLVTARNVCGHRACHKAIRVALDALLNENVKETTVDKPFAVFCDTDANKLAAYLQDTAWRSPVNLQHLHDEARQVREAGSSYSRIARFATREEADADAARRNATARPGITYVAEYDN